MDSGVVNLTWVPELTVYVPAGKASTLHFTNRGPELPPVTVTEHVPLAEVRPSMTNGALAAIVPASARWQTVCGIEEMLSHGSVQLEATTARH